MKKFKSNYVTHLRLAESFKTMNWPEPAVSFFMAFFIGKHKRQRCEFVKF